VECKSAQLGHEIIAIPDLQPRGEGAILILNFDVFGHKENLLLVSQNK
jgi:hypothetical protein